MKTAKLKEMKLIILIVALCILKVKLQNPV